MYKIVNINDYFNKIDVKNFNDYINFRLGFLYCIFLNETNKLYLIESKNVIIGYYDFDSIFIIIVINIKNINDFTIYYLNTLYINKTLYIGKTKFIQKFNSETIINYNDYQHKIIYPNYIIINTHNRNNKYFIRKFYNYKLFKTKIFSLNYTEISTKIYYYNNYYIYIKSQFMKNKIKIIPFDVIYYTNKAKYLFI